MARSVLLCATALLAPLVTLSGCCFVPASSPSPAPGAPGAASAPAAAPSAAFAGSCDARARQGICTDYTQAQIDLVGEAFTRENCALLGTFVRGPCPVEGRIGTCVGIIGTDRYYAGGMFAPSQAQGTCEANDGRYTPD